MTLNVFARALLAVVAFTTFSGTASAIPLVIFCASATTPAELQATISCPKFDNALGFLTSMSITITGDITGSMTFTNGGSTTQTFVGTTTTQYTVGALGGFNFANPFVSSSFTSGPRTVTAGQTLTVVGFSGSANRSVTNLTNLSPYAGSGLFSVSISTATSFASTGGGGFASSGQSTTAGASVTVTYNYQPFTLGRTDFDGDGRNDVTVFRPSDATWQVAISSTNFATAFSYQWGITGDIPVPGDYDGDGKTDFAIYRPSTGDWYALKSSTNNTAYIAARWGGFPEDVPVPGDYDGDGKTDMGFFRRERPGSPEGVWFILLSSFNFVASTGGVSWGAGGDIPAPADYDGDGRVEMAVYRPSEGNWYILKFNVNTGTGTWTIRQWGINGDTPRPADYDGDGKADLAIFRPSTGMWYILKSNTNNTAWDIIQWGAPTDIPITGDYDGDGKADLGVHRSSDGNRYVLRSISGYTNWYTFHWGITGDIP